MVDGTQVVAMLVRLGFTHVVWIPDSETGTWNDALSADGTLKIIRPTREGEAIAIAGGLHLGGAKPLVIMQCTGLFEAGDALRNMIHDLKLPLVFIIGVRSYTAHREGRSRDTCPVYTEPILKAWEIPYALLDRGYAVSDLERELYGIVSSNRAGAVLLAE